MSYITLEELTPGETRPRECSEEGCERPPYAPHSRCKACQDRYLHRLESEALRRSESR